MLAILASPVLAFPCECSTSPFPDAVIGSDLVILGRIAKVEPTDPSGGWTIEIAVTKVLRGASSPKSVRIGGGRIAGCEWTADEFTRAGRADRPGTHEGVDRGCGVMLMLRCGIARGWKRSWLQIDSDDLAATGG